MGTVAATAIPLPIRIESGGAILNGDLAVPTEAVGLVVFAHGSGSSRHSSRNRAVAEVLHRARLGTLMLDLLTDQEERADVVTAEFRFDIPLLGERVVAALDWAHTSPATSSLSFGLFGASTGAAAALIAAAERPRLVRAVVSRGGRPDLADGALDRVAAPTLLIVGERDEVVIRLNEQAYARLRGPKQLVIVPRATHLFEEPGALAHVAELARDWFVRYLTSSGEGEL
jgi:pimeloyl-ACP methyl ester carboxylesterase